MNSEFGREICGNLNTAEGREWLITNGIGGYASGTVSGLLTRCYHGLLLAALNPPLGMTLMLTKLDETAVYNSASYPLHTNRWANDVVSPHGYKQIEKFYLDGTSPVWIYACADALLEKRIWMQQGENTTYISYRMLRGTQPLTLNLKALVNYRSRHGNTQNSDLPFGIVDRGTGIEVTAFESAANLYLSGIKNVENISWDIKHEWYRNFALSMEEYRGLTSSEDHLCAATCSVTLDLGESITVVASSENKVTGGQGDWGKKKKREKELIELFAKNDRADANIPNWIEQLVLAADQFIVARPLADIPNGKTVIAGYPWFGDWGRDTMISLPGLTLTTGRYEIAKVILQTFAKYVDRGMLPNVFPDEGETPEYNTVDATLWYFEAIRDYYAHTQDQQLLAELFPVLAEIIDWHRRGTRYNIHLDDDGLIYAGEAGVQLTWMDAKVGDWVVTPRIGKPIEVNALWYNALIAMSHFASCLGKSDTKYLKMADETRKGFQRFWNEDLQYCYDVLDTPNGNDDSLRPNQIFAVSLPATNINYSLDSNYAPLLNKQQQQQVVDIVAERLLTSNGLRSFDTNHPDYVGIYGGSPLQRDGAYHQGTTWSWLIGHFVQAHLRVYDNSELASSFIVPMAHHLKNGCIGTISEIFDGDAPFVPRGAFAQAWSVAELLRVWKLVSYQ